MTSGYAFYTASFRHISKTPWNKRVSLYLYYSSFLLDFSIAKIMKRQIKTGQPKLWLGLQIKLWSHSY